MRCGSTPRTRRDGDRGECHAESERVGRHVAGVGEQRERSGDDRGDDLHARGTRRSARAPTRAAAGDARRRGPDRVPCECRASDRGRADGPSCSMLRSAGQRWPRCAARRVPGSSMSGGRRRASTQRRVILGAARVDRAAASSAPGGTRRARTDEGDGAHGVRDQAVPVRRARSTRTGTCSSRRGCGRSTSSRSTPTG